MLSNSSLWNDDNSGNFITRHVYNIILKLFEKQIFLYGYFTSIELRLRKSWTKWAVVAAAFGITIVMILRTSNPCGYFCCTFIAVIVVVVVVIVKIVRVTLKINFGRSTTSCCGCGWSLVPYRSTTTTMIAHGNNVFDDYLRLKYHDHLHHQ